MLELGKDLPTTRQDIEAQKNAKFLDMPEPERYLEFLESLESLGLMKGGDFQVRRKGPRGDKPFELLV